MREDELLKQYLSDNDRYVDLINGMVFGGRQILKPEDLSPLDSQTGKNRSKYRDLIRQTAFGVNIAVIGLENQSEVHYLMPLRAMIYDGEEYQRQAAIIGKVVSKRKEIDGPEYLSRFGREDRLNPCVTLVLFYGEEWDGSRDLHGLLDFTDIPEELKALVGNYPLNLLEIRKLEQTDIYRTDLKQVFDFIRYSKDAVKLRELVENDPAYKEMDTDAYDVAVAFTKATELIEIKKYHEKEDKVNMCEALTKMLQDERREGIEQGIEQGREQGLQALISLVRKGCLSVQDAAASIKMSEADFSERMTLIK